MTMIFFFKFIYFFMVSRYSVLVWICDSLCVKRNAVLNLFYNNIKLKKRKNFEERHSMELTYAYESQGGLGCRFHSTARSKCQ